MTVHSASHAILEMSVPLLYIPSHMLLFVPFTRCIPNLNPVFFRYKNKLRSHVQRMLALYEHKEYGYCFTIIRFSILMFSIKETH